MATRADAAWVGWGFVAEDPAFAELCERLGIVFVGPDAGGDAPARRQDRRQAARRGGGRPGRAVERRPRRARSTEALEHASQDRLSADDQGDRRRRRPRDPARSSRSTRPARRRSPSAQAEALEAFGDATVLLERLISPARHVEVQVIADGQGTVWALGVRDCSVQRRHQKVIEESASAGAHARAEPRAPRRRRAARAAGRLPRRRHGRVPLRPADAADLSFMEVNTRLQVEHPVTEVDDRASTSSSSSCTSPPAGAWRASRPPRAVTRSRRASTPRTRRSTSRPRPGRVALLRLPTGPGLRIDTGVARGRRDPGRVRLDDRQGHRLGQRPRRGARPPAPRAGRDDRGDRRRHDQPGVPAGAARALRTCAPARSTPAGSTGCSCAARRCRHATARSRCSQPRSSSPTRSRRTIGRASSPSPAAAVRRSRARARARSSCVTAASATASRSIRSGRSPTGSRSRDAETSRCELQRLGRVRAPAADRRPGLPDGDLRSRATELLVEVDGVSHRVARDEGGIVRTPLPAVVVSIPVAVGRRGRRGRRRGRGREHEDGVLATSPRSADVCARCSPAANVHARRAGPDRAHRAARRSSTRADRARTSSSRISEAEPELEAPARCHDNLARLERLMLGYDIEAGEVNADRRRPARRVLGHARV